MLKTITVTLPDNVKKEYEAGNTLDSILKTSESSLEPLLAIVDGEFKELSEKIYDDAVIYPVTIEKSLGVRTYMRSLAFLLVKAVKDIFPEARVTIEHSLNKGLYGEVHYIRPITEDDIAAIKNKMEEIVQRDLLIEKIKMSKEEAVKIFESYKMEDKIRLLEHTDFEKIDLYKCEELYDYFYGPVVPSMGYLKIFDIKFYKPGFILLFPNENTPFAVPEFKDLPKLAKVFKETENWAEILDVAGVGALNEKVQSGEIEDIILVAEGFHEKKIARIADKIYENKDNIKIALIAGPSSSGKTTFSKRLSIQLRVLGLKPYPISLDDYFVDREHTPKDENGNYDFESINALDLELFNNQLMALLSGNEIELPVFNFITGQREWSGKKFRMDENSILVVEGIHGLNENLTSLIPKKNKYKIYVSALTQLNIDDHNRIPTTDVRILRRIVRDYNFRGKSAEDTILSWPQVRAGEEKNIFPYQEEADIMFNSTLAYEMSILKKYAYDLLKKINKSSPAYLEAKRLIIFLSYFKEATGEIIPKNSIIREFIGGSCFYK